MKNFRSYIALLGLLLSAVIVRGAEGPSLSIRYEHPFMTVLWDAEGAEGFELQTQKPGSEWITVPQELITGPNVGDGGAEVTLTWDRNPTNELVQSYFLYWGGAHRTYTNSIAAEDPPETVTGLTYGSRYFFACTASNFWGESVFSNEAETRIAVIKRYSFTNILKQQIFRLRKP
jgi:hypothetical protein